MFELNRKIANLESEISNFKMILKDKEDYIEESKRLVDLER